MVDSYNFTKSLKTETRIERFEALHCSQLMNNISEFYQLVSIQQ